MQAVQPALSPIFLSNKTKLYSGTDTVPFYSIRAHKVLPATSHIHPITQTFIQHFSLCVSTSGNIHSLMDALGEIWGSCSKDTSVCELEEARIDPLNF